MADVKQQEVVAQDAKLVGDEEVQAEVREPTQEVNKESVPAQVSPEREAPSKEVPVHETAVKLDEVITDPSSPLAVQVPDAGRGSLDLPIHQLGEPTPEAVFAEEAADADEPEDDDQPAPPSE
jgi:hypothetical protein